MAEDDRNDFRIVQPPELNGFGLDCHWLDDFHHALHTQLTGESQGYYEDFGGLPQLATAYRQGFVYSGQYSRYRRRRHGSPARHIKPYRFIAFAQNHDQVGNRLLGERLSRLTSLAGLKIAAAAVILSPFLPLLFMGEEYGETAPFYYFVSHGDPDLIESIRQGRAREFSDFGWDIDPLDPQAPETFHNSHLQAALAVQEPHQALWRYYAREIFPDNLETGFLQRLKLAKSNIPEHQDGKLIYEKFVRPAMVDLLEVGVHYAISSIFEDYDESDSIFCYDIHREDYRRSEAGKATLVMGQIQVASQITHNSGMISFAVLHLGDHNIYGGVRFFQGQEAYDVMVWKVAEVFAGADFLKTIRCLDRHFESSTYSLRSLFRDEQRKVLDDHGLVLQDVVSTYQQIYKYHVPLMRFITDLVPPCPMVICHGRAGHQPNLRQAFEAEEPTELISGLEELISFHRN